MIKRLALVASFVLLLVAIWWRVHRVGSLSASLKIPQVQAQGSSCGLIGNNTAVTPGRVTTANVNESAFTLVLLTGSADEIEAIVTLINSSTQTVIIRLGAGVGTENLSAEQYAGILNSIAGRVTKPFVATAGHNEPNCAEWVPERGYDYEVAFTKAVGLAVTDPKVTLITGQIDHYCGVVNDKTATEYITALMNLTGIEGVALPYYVTDGTPDAQKTYNYFMGYVNTINSIKSGFPIYITESGPLKTDSFEEFARAVPLISGLPQLKAFLLFNAFGYNGSGGFAYTKPFWQAACREAFRTQCTNPDKVIEICGKGVGTPYYLYTIEGLNNQSQTSEQDRAIGLFHNLVKQGYEAKCTTPRFSLAAKVSGDVADFEATHPPQVVGSFNITSTEEIDATGAFIPLWRNQESIPASGISEEKPDNAAQGGIFDSIERNFGHRDSTPATTDEELRLKNLKSGHLYGLTTRGEQCAREVETLRYIKYLCEQLEDPSSCALYQPIQNFPGYTTESLLTAFETSALTCDKIINTKLEGVQLEIARALDEVPLYLEKAYRLAFLVAVTEMKPDQSAQNIFFNFFASDNNGTIPETKHKVSVIAFKIPDIGTNRENVADVPYSDPLQIVRDAITPHEVIEQRKQEQAEELDRYTNQPFSGHTPRILCGGENCTDPITKALTDVVNGSNDEDVVGSCVVDGDDLKAEDAQIGDSGNLLDDAAKGASGSGTTNTSGSTGGNGFFFKPGYDLLQSIFARPEAQRTNPQKSSFGFISNLNPMIRERSGGTDTVFYLVAPMGYNLEKLEESMVSRIFTNEGRVAFEDNAELAEYFKTQGITPSFESNSAEYPFAGPDYFQCLAVNPLNPAACLKKIKIGIEPEAEDHDTRILGGKLGYLLRSLQGVETESQSGPNLFALTCKTLDEYFRGACQGSAEDSNDDLTTDDITPVAQCEAGSARYTTGEAAVHYQSGVGSCTRYNPDDQNIPRWKDPGDSHIPCQDLYSRVACVYPNTLLQNNVNTSGDWDTAGTQTACEYIVAKSKAAGVSPQFALAMFFEETGGGDSSDYYFGVRSVDSSRGHLGQQLQIFLNSVNNASDYQSFLHRYSEGLSPQHATYFCANPPFPGRVASFYNYLSEN